MSDIIRLDAAALAEKIAAKELSSTEVTQAFLDQIAATDQKYRAFLHVAGDEALKAAAATDSALSAGERPASPLAGVPLALKDVFTSLDMPTTCGSKILEGWRSPYDATVTALAERGRDMDIELVDRPDHPSAGAGETPIMAIAPAIANAVFRATGQRVREMPIKLKGASPQARSATP